MSLHEIVLPETKPETEWVRGRAVQKMSPKRRHARLQGALYKALDPWAQDRGEINTEWRFRLQPPGEIRRPLVPDLAYMSYERLRGLTGEDLEAPPIAPEVAIEILSPGDSKADLEEKIRVYLATGALLIMVVDAERRRVLLCDPGGPRAISDGETIAHAALPGFSLGVDELLRVIEPPSGG